MTQANFQEVVFSNDDVLTTCKVINTRASQWHFQAAEDLRSCS